jgi:hypothetical protein
MNLKGYAKKQPWHNFKFYPNTCLERLTGTLRNLNQDSWTLNQDLKPLNTMQECSGLDCDIQCHVYQIYLKQWTMANTI